ncbi:DNA polymerase domain-containing protein [Haloarchaeobius iranensis]|uniref:DNA polymerase n=1 Tax=Haloarchaeobius iranensis TaxID=996166 RepID=A0A1G9T5H8_9EURY|nr:DNA polymerase domain-containing protein [Haloarchaeobius iranensis]SDM42887.1 DNA polymerase I [Haloarchaeobius iranensis]
MTDAGDSEQLTLGGAFGDGGSADSEDDGLSESDLVAEAEAVTTPGLENADFVEADEALFPDPDGTVSLSVMQVDYTVEGSGEHEQPVMHVFGRTAEGTAEHVMVFGFQPYFYAPTDSLDESELEDENVIVDWEATDVDGEPYESIRGERLTKIFGRTPRDVGNIRDRFDHYEADVLFPNRFLVDKGINSGITVPARRGESGSIRVPHEEVEATELTADPRVNTFDIEVDDRNGFPEDGDEPIICLTSHDSYDDEYVVWLAIADEYDGDAPDALPDYDPIEGELDLRVEIFDGEDQLEAERKMLEAFLDYIDETDPDVMTGWNCLPEDSEVQMADGTTTEIKDVSVGDAVVGSEGQETAVAEVTNKWSSEKEILEFTLDDGTTLESSADHRIMVGDDADVDWKEGGDIEVGDYVLKPRRLPVAEERLPTFSELVPVDRQRYASQETISRFKGELPYGAVTELAERFDVEKETLYHPSPTVWSVERCREAAANYDVPVPDGGRVHKETGAELDREMTEDELYLAGLVLTDGTMSTDSGVRFYNTKPELHDQFPGSNTQTPDGKGCYKQNVLDYATMYAFNGLGIPLGDKNETDVDLSPVFRMPEEYVSSFLAGVIDGDGSIGKTGITVAAENESIGEWYVKLFKRLGIYAQQNRNVVRIPDSQRDIGRLKRRVLPEMNHPAKVESLRAFEGGRSGQTENISYALFDPDSDSEVRRVGEDKHRRGINLKRHESVNDDWEEYVFVEVTDVSVTGTETTYDIETTTHNFVAESCLVHNCDDFDAPYFLDRLEVLDSTMHDQDIDPNRLSRVNEVWRSGWGGPNVKGRVVFDLLYAYKSRQFTELDSYRLDAVGETELDAGKERYTGDIGDLWENDPGRLLEYNLRDVELCVEIDAKQDIISFYDEVRTFVGCKLEDAPTAGDAVDMYVLQKVHGEFALPSKGKQESEDYEGGAVFDPITGVKEMVTVLDLKSLYPMCMVTINASPETKVDPESFDGDTYRAPNGTHFRKDEDGMIRAMVDELLAEREAKKELRNQHDPGSQDYERYDQQQAAVKVIMNSLYGVLGWDRFRLYDKEMGAAVTATGREVIRFTEQAANEINYQVAYGDTDSVMLELGQDVTPEGAIEQSFEIEEHINDSYDAFAAEELNVDIEGGEEHRFQIEFEKLYRRFFQAGKKKRYAGHIIWKEGKHVDDIDITGFEYKRSDIAPITKEVQHEVIDKVVRGAEESEITEYIHDVIERFLAGEYSYDEIAIPGGIGKRIDNYDTDTAHVRGAKYANLLFGTNFDRGSKPKRLYLEKVHPDYFKELEDAGEFDPQRDHRYGEFKREQDVICFDYADQIPAEFEVDYDKMLDKTLKGPIARVIEALGISWEEVKTGQEQTGLGSFM